MLKINLLPDSERAIASDSDFDLGFGKRQIDWFSLTPKILGGVLGLLILVTVVFFYLPNLKRAKESDKLQREWKKLEPDYNKFVEKEKEEQKYLTVLNEFYRFIDERSIWSRHLHVLAKNLPREIRFIKLIAQDQTKKYDSIKKISVEDEKGNIKFIDKVVPNTKLVHVITLNGLVPIDGQARVIAFKKNLEKDDFLKNVLIEAKIPGITATSNEYKSFNLEIVLDSVKAIRE